MPPPPNTLQFTLGRGDSGLKKRQPHGCPMRLQISSPWELDGVTELRVEIHDQRKVTGRTPLALAQVTNPTGYEVIVDFDWDQMVLPMKGQTEQSFFLLVRTISGGVPDVLEMGTITLWGNPASDLAAPGATASIFASTALVGAETANRTAADAAEATARAAGDNALAAAATADRSAASGSGATASAALAAYLEQVQAMGGTPSLGLAFFVRTHNGNNVPSGLYKDQACTVPATLDGDQVKGWKDPDSGRIFTDFSATGVLRFAADGQPVVRCAGSGYGTAGLSGVTALVAVSKKAAVLDHHALVADNVNFFGLWETRSAGGSGMGFTIMGDNTSEENPERVANDEGLAITGPRMLTGFLYRARVNHAINGRWENSRPSQGVSSGTIATIGYAANNPGMLFQGDLYGIAAVTGPVTPAGLDGLHGRMARIFRTPLTSLLRTLVLVDGNSISVGFQAGANNAYGDQLQRWLGLQYRVEIVAAGGYTIDNILAQDFQSLYDAEGISFHLLMEGTNQYAGTGPDRTVATALAGLRASYLRQKAIKGRVVIGATATYRNEMGNPPPEGTVSIAEHKARTDQYNAVLRQPASIGYYHDAVEDVGGDSRFADPNNTTYFADHVHPTAEMCRILAQEYFGPAILRFMQRH